MFQTRHARLLLAALLALVACKRERDPAPAPAALPTEAARPLDEPRSSEPAQTPPPAATPQDDLPLPKEDEVPAFLLGRGEQPSPKSQAQETSDGAAPSLRDLMAKVQVSDGAADEGSFAWIQSDEPPVREQEPAHALPAEPEDPVAEPPAAPRKEARQAPGDPCAPLRDAIAQRKDFLRRVAAERDNYGWVESQEDAAALRTLAAMRRCAEHPDDEDCKPPPMEVSLQEREPPRHQYERWPTDLDAEGKEADDIPHDPGILDLLHRLKQCERDPSHQPKAR